LRTLDTKNPSFEKEPEEPCDMTVAALGRAAALSVALVICLYIGFFQKPVSTFWPVGLAMIQMKLAVPGTRHLPDRAVEAA
jgi:hypothetical protein